MYVFFFFFWMSNHSPFCLIVIWQLIHDIMVTLSHVIVHSISAHVWFVWFRPQVRPLPPRCRLTVGSLSLSLKLPFFFILQRLMIGIVLFIGTLWCKWISVFSVINIPKKNKKTNATHFFFFFFFIIFFFFFFFFFSKDRHQLSWPGERIEGLYQRCEECSQFPHEEQLQAQRYPDNDRRGGGSTYATHSQ